MTDPRIEAAAKVIAPVAHNWHDGFSEGKCPACQDVARDALAAADAVDPVRCYLSAIRSRYRTRAENDRLRAEWRDRP